MTNNDKLIRGIGKWDLCAITVNSIIGAGIFGLPSKVYALIGPYSVLAFVACALIVGAIVLCYAEVASRFSATGGPYLYAKVAFGPVVAFEVGWLYWVVRVTTFAANCNLFVTYLGFFLPGITEGAGRIATIGILVLTIVVVNVMGIRESATMTNLITVGKVVPLCVFAFVGLFFLQPANFTLGDVPGYSEFSNAVLILIYAFVGFEVAVIPAGEARDPQRSIPFALIFSLAIVAVLYLAVQVVCIGTLPELARSERPLADAAMMFLGPSGAAFITTGAMLSILGNLNVGLLGGTRLFYAMAERGEMPASLGRTHPRFKTPHLSIVITGLVILVMTIYSTFLVALAIATITRLFVFATTCLALPIFRFRSDVPPAQFQTPGGVALALVSLLLIGWLLTHIHLTREGLPILAVAVVGLAIWMFHRLTTRASAVSSASAGDE